MMIKLVNQNKSKHVLFTALLILYFVPTLSQSVLYGDAFAGDSLRSEFSKLVGSYYDHEYTIEYVISEGSLERIEPVKGFYGLNFFVSEHSQERTLELKIPHDLYYSALGYLSTGKPEALAFSSYPGAYDIESYDYDVYSDCEFSYVKLTIPPNVSSGTLLGVGIMRGDITDAWPKPKAGIITAVSSGDAEIILGFNTAVKKCELTLNESEKTLTINFDEPANGSFHMEILNEQFGGPYNVIVDGNESFIRENTGSAVILTSEDQNTINTLDVPLNNTKRIDIIATTIIPEFPSVMAVMMLSILSILFFKLGSLQKVGAAI